MIGNNGDKHKLDPKIIGSIGVAGTAVVTIVLSALLVGGLNDAADASYVKAYDDYQTELMVKQSIAKLNVDATVNNSNTSEKSEIKPSLMQVGDDWYVAGNDSTVPSNNDSIIVDGTVYNKLDNTQKNDSSIEDAAEIPFYGTEWVVVDIDGNMVYLVEKGDTLTDVSGRVGYSVQELADANYIDNVNLIYEGQTIRIPASPEAIEYIKSHDNQSSNDENIIESESTEEDILTEDVSEDETILEKESDDESSLLEEESETQATKSEKSSSKETESSDTNSTESKTSNKRVIDVDDIDKTTNTVKSSKTDTDNSIENAEEPESVESKTTTSDFQDFIKKTGMTPDARK